MEVHTWDSEPKKDLSSKFSQFEIKYLWTKKKNIFRGFFQEQIEISVLLSVSTVQIKKFVSKGPRMTLCSRICQTTLNNLLWESWDTHKCTLRTSRIRWILFDLLYFALKTSRPLGKFTYLYTIYFDALYLIASHENSRLFLLTSKVVLKEEETVNDVVIGSSVVLFNLLMEVFFVPNR